MRFALIGSPVLGKHPESVLELSFRAEARAVFGHPGAEVLLVVGPRV